MPSSPKWLRHLRFDTFHVTSKDFIRTVKLPVVQVDIFNEKGELGNLQKNIETFMFIFYINIKILDLGDSLRFIEKESLV